MLDYDQLLDLARQVYHLEHITCASCLRHELPKAFADQEYAFTDDAGRDFSWHVELTQLLTRQYPRHVRFGVQIPGDQLERMLTICTIEPEHLDHLPTEWLTRAGLMVTILAPTNTEEQILIDGSHRLHRAHREGRRFYVHLLDLTLSTFAHERSAELTQQKLAQAALGRGAVAELIARARQLRLI